MTALRTAWSWLRTRALWLVAGLTVVVVALWRRALGQRDQARRDAEVFAERARLAEESAQREREVADRIEEIERRAAARRAEADARAKVEETQAAEEVAKVRREVATTGSAAESANDWLDEAGL